VKEEVEIDRSERHLRASQIVGVADR